jgi:predicted outer membrane protein
MTKLAEAVEAYKITENNKIVKVLTLKVSVKEHGYYLDLNQAKKALLKSVNSDISYHLKSIKRDEKYVTKELKDISKEKKIVENLLKVKKSVGGLK